MSIPAGMNPIAIGNGGTNATTAHQALTNLGGIGSDSPNFTGTITAAAANFSGAVAFTGPGPTAPTAPAVTNTTQLATTAFVKQQGFGVGTITAVNAGVGLTGGGASGAVTLALTAATNPNVGTFQGLTVDTYGRVTAASNQNYLTGITSAQVTGALGFTPLSPANNLSELASKPTALATLGGAPLANAPAAGPNGSVLASNGTVAAYSRDLTGLNSIVTAGTIQAGNNIISLGNTAGFIFAERTAGTRWVWYADAGLTRLYAAADVLTVDASGNVNLPAGNGIQYRFSASGNRTGFGWIVGAPNTLHAYVDATDLGPIQFTASSRAGKIGIVTATKDALACLQRIELYAFDRLMPLDEKRHEEIGFIAEQVRPLIPEAALVAEDDTVSGLDLMPLLAHAVGAIQQLAARVAVLEAMVR